MNKLKKKMSKSENKTMDNFNNFLISHPMVYRNAHMHGYFFEKVNELKQRVFAFPIRKDATIREGDIVMLDSSCRAYPISMYESFPEDVKLFSESIGTAYFTAFAEEANVKIVFVGGMSVLRMKNSSDPNYCVTSEDIGGPCYLEDANTVSLDPDKGFAGQVMSIEGEDVLVYVRLTWEDVKAW